MADYTLKRDVFHYKWDRSHRPALTVRPGDTVTFDINEVTSWQITEDSDSETVRNLDVSKLYPLSGPVEVQGAEPGDALSVEVLDVKTGEYGWSAIIGGLGLLEEFDEPYLYKWNLRGGVSAEFVKGINVPIRPFCGVMGVALPERGAFDVLPPGKNGGNLDIRHLTKGSRIELPVWVGGALFSTGDLHAAMGDGEVCVTAIECPGKATFRFGLRKGAKIGWPRYFTGSEAPPSKGYFVTTGVRPDLMEAAKDSVRTMIEHLTLSHGLSREEAYVLCSVAADLRVHEVVDAPNWVVGAMMPLDVFP